MGFEELGVIAGLAVAQAGCFTVDQADGLGVSRRTVERARRHGVVVRMHPRVMRFADTTADRTACIWAAVLQAGNGAAASHQAALFLHGVTHVPFRIAVTVAPDASHRVDGARVHRLHDLRSHERSTVLGVPATTLPRAVVDVSSAYPLTTMRHLVDQVTITQRLTSVGAIARTLRQVNRRGRFAIGNVGIVLDERSAGGPIPRSLLEMHVDALLACSPLPAAIAEMPIPGGEMQPGLVDRAWPDARLILEVDGRTWHSRERCMARDRARDRLAARSGWMTVRVLDEEVTACPREVLDDIAAIHADRTGLVGLSTA